MSSSSSLVFASLLLAAFLVAGCSQPIQEMPREDPRAQQERQERMQREHRDASERLDRQTR